jgi:DNA-directed RNA polymerase specialized sigma24 family protein
MTIEERFELEAIPHLNDIFRTANRLVGERQSAEDVSQEVFLRACTTGGAGSSSGS